VRLVDDRGELPELAIAALHGPLEIEDSDRDEAIVNAPATVITWLEPDSLASQADAGIPLRHAEEGEDAVRVDEAGLEA
jgi:hypothetical protein